MAEEGIVLASGCTWPDPPSTAAFFLGFCPNYPFAIHSLRIRVEIAGERVVGQDGDCGGWVLSAILSKIRSNVYNFESKPFILLTWKAISISLNRCDKWTNAPPRRLS